MYSSTRCYLFVLLIVTFQTLTNCQYEGEICFHKRRATNGVCKLLQQCPEAKKDLSAGKYPQNCGIQGTVVVVCCPESGGPSPITTTTTTTTTTTIRTPTIILPTGSLPAGEKSKRACKAYEDLGYVLEVSPILDAGSSFYDKNGICPWEREALPVIISGKKTKQGEFPHMALIGYGTPDSYEWKCGGSLISDRFILTAAHCMTRGLGEPRFVRLGDINYTDTTDDQYAQQINVKKIHIHPKRKFPHHYNDIALLELEKSANLNINVKPACLEVDKSADRSVGIITGWGTTEHAKPSDHLLKANVRRFLPEVCNRTFMYERRTLPRGIDADLQICYGSNSTREDSCQGDSGGPIQMYADEYCSYNVFGITSFGQSCGNEGIPGVYVKVSPYIEWIENLVWP